MESKRKYNIIFRACDSVVAVNKNPRPFNLEKRQLIKICFLSLVDSLKGLDVKIIVLGDKLSEDMVSFFNSFNVDLRLGNFGNGGSILETFKIATTIPNDEWIYFCEDDYLHVPHAFGFIDHFIQEKNSILSENKKPAKYFSRINFKYKDLFIYPPDYPDCYKLKYRRKSKILISSDCHWRQVNSITFTFLTKSSTFKKHLSLFNKSAAKARDRMISRNLFGRTAFLTSSVCFSPMPGVSTHMHRDTMTPLVKWEQLVLEYNAKINTLDY